MKVTCFLFSFLESVGLIVLSAIVGTVLLILAFSIPSKRIRNNVKGSVPQLKQESNYFSVTRGIKGSRLDNYTDATYLNASLFDNKNRGVFTSLYGSVFHSASEKGPVYNLCEVVSSAEYSEISNSAIRFWNGGLIFIKTLLCVTNYSGVRYINFLLQMLIMFLLLCVMRKKELEDYMFPVFVLYLFLNPVTIALCMAFAGFFYCAFVPSIVIMLFNNKLLINQRYLLFFELLGICVIYFNVNYIQLLTFGVPLLFYYLINGFPVSIRKLLKQISLFFLFWFVGYAGMMVSKWIVLYICTGENIFEAMIRQALFRISSSYQEKYWSRLDAIKINIREFENRVYILIEFIFICVCVVRIKLSKIKIGMKNFLIPLSVVIVMIILVIGRYAVFSNHVYIHYWVTYRLLVLPVFAFNVFLTSLFCNRSCFAN